MAARLFGSSERARREQESEEQRLELESSSARDEAIPRSMFSPRIDQEVFSDPFVAGSGAHFQTSTVPEDPESSTGPRAGKRPSDWSEDTPSKFARKLDATLAPSPVLSPDMGPVYPDLEPITLDTDFSLPDEDVRALMAGTPWVDLFQLDDFQILPPLRSPNPAPLLEPLPTSPIASIESFTLSEAERRVYEALTTTEQSHTGEEVADAYVNPQSQSSGRSPAKQDGGEGSGMGEESKAVVAKPKQKSAKAKKESTQDESTENKGEKKKKGTRKSQAKPKPAKPVDGHESKDNAPLTAEVQAVAVGQHGKEVVTPPDEHTEARTLGVEKKVASPLKTKTGAAIGKQAGKQFATPPAQRPQSRLTRANGRTDTPPGVAYSTPSYGPNLRGGEGHFFQSPLGVEVWATEPVVYEGKVWYNTIQPQNEITVSPHSDFSHGQPIYPGAFGVLPSAPLLLQHTPTPMPNNIPPGTLNSVPHGPQHQQMPTPMTVHILQGPPQIGPHGSLHQHAPTPMPNNLFHGPAQPGSHVQPYDPGRFVSMSHDGPPFANPLGTIPPHWPIHGPVAANAPMAHGWGTVEQHILPLGQALPPDAAGPRYVPWTQEGPPGLQPMHLPFQMPQFDPWQVGAPNSGRNAFQHQVNGHIGSNQQWYPPIHGGWH